MQKKTKKSFPGSIVDFFLKSLIVSWLCSFTSALYKKISSSISAAVFTSYDLISEKLMESNIVKHFLRDPYERSRRSVTLKIAMKYEQSLFSVFINKVKWTLLTCQLNVIALFGLTFGFTSALILILDNFAFAITKITLSGIINIINPLITSFSFIIIAILFIFSKKPLIRAINESLFFNFLFFDFFAMRKVPASDYEHRLGLNAGIAALLGILLGGISLWISPSKIAAALGILIIFLIVLHSPEAGIIGMIFLIPFTPTMALVFLVCSTALSFFLKCCRRKRLMKPEGLDILVGIFGVFIISGGFISVDVPSSMPKMLVFICFISVYFIVKNVVRTETLIFSCARSIAVSSMIVAFIGISEYLIGDVSQIWQDVEMFGDIRGRAVSTFGNPNVLGEYLIMVIPVLFAMFLCAKKFNLKALFFVSFALCCTCLTFTWSRGAWLGLAFAALVFILLKSPAFLAGIILLSPALLLALSVIMNSNMIERLLSIGNLADSSTSYRLNIWFSVFDMLEDKGLYGIGIGTEAFSSVFPQYAIMGTESAPHTHSLYLQIIAETGIFSLLSFVLIVLAYISLVFSYLRKAHSPGNRTMSIGFLCSISAFLVQGFTDYTWYNYRVYLFFWLMLGFAMAVMNLCKENERRKYLYA